MRPTLGDLRALYVSVLIGCASAAPPPSQAPPGNVTRESPAPVRLGGPSEHAYTEEFFPGTTYDGAIATPDSILGFATGERPAHHEQVLACWRKWAQQSKRVKLETYGHTYEGRELVCGVIASEANLEKLDSILASIGKLADPRKLTAGEEANLISQTPAIAWLGYSIHGDEMSGVDGGLALAYHLIAGTSKEVKDLLEQVVVVIDPMQNPDGRERFLSLLLQMNAATPVLDGDALSHGRWPYGRGNHYLFDMNRDWIAGVAPETRGRWTAVQRFHPQLFVDAHEMGRDDSYLFYPQADPLNPHLPQKLIEWQKRYGAGIAESFDRHGWSYYTREWADGWGPFYSDSWGSLNGAIGILYEQARFDGQTVKLQSGEIATYREAVHHQAVASLANVDVLAKNREAALREYLRQRCLDTFGREGVAADAAPRTPPVAHPLLVIEPGPNTSRNDWLLRTLVSQGVEVESLAGSATCTGAVAADGTTTAELALAGPLWIVAAQQPQGALARAFLEFDTRYPKADLERERRELETKGSSKIYDTTAWDFVHALDARAWWCDAIRSDAKRQLLALPAPREGSIAPPEPANSRVYGWLVDGADDASVVFACEAMELGLEVNLADEPFQSAGRDFERGSLLVRAHENGTNATELVAKAAKRARVQVFAATSARAPGEGHDLGGQHFHLLERPRVAMLSNSPVSPDSFGHLWHELDQQLGLAVSLLDAQDLGGYDLRHYNVVVLPPAGGMGASVAAVKDDLEAWIRSGGTLVAIGGSASALCSEELGLSGVRRRADVLADLEGYRFAAQREASGKTIAIDEEALWNGAKKSDAKPEDEAKKEGSKDAPRKDVDPDPKRQDGWMQRFSPQGVFLRALVRTDQWITSGAGDELPVFFDGSTSLWSRSPVTTAVRLAPAEKLRLSGLLWPEARERLADSAYLTVERLGNGQVILFASQPGFRGYHKATGRLFANAVVYGPGAGANPVRPR